MVFFCVTQKKGGKAITFFFVLKSSDHIIRLCNLELYGLCRISERGVL